MAAFSKQLMKQNIFRALLGLAIAAVALLRAENLSRVVNRATPEILVREALEKNPELNFYAAGIAAAKGGLKTAGTIRNPEFNTQAGYKNARDKSGGTFGDGAAWSLSVNQTFEYPGRIALRKAIAQGDIELAELHFEQFRLTLAARVRALAYSIVIAQERSAATREMADRFQALTDVLAQREPAGVTPVIGSGNYRCEHAHVAAAGTGSRRSPSKTAVAELNQLRGRPVTAPLRDSGGQSGFVQVSLQTLLDAARNQRLRHSHSRGRIGAARIQSFAVEKRTLSGNCGRAVLFAGECGGQRTAGWHWHFSAAALLGPQRRKHSNEQGA